MYPVETDPPAGARFLEAQLDFFHKLGYSTAQVQAVQKKFGPGVDTNKVLGELMKTGAGVDGGRGPGTTMSVLVPRGDLQPAGPMLQMPVAASSPQSIEETSEEEDALRPIVIDGSNVAMR